MSLKVYVEDKSPRKHQIKVHLVREQVGRGADGPTYSNRGPVQLCVDFDGKSLVDEITGSPIHTVGLNGPLTIVIEEDR